MKNFKDKVVLVTGAASGIGRATALEFARQGSHIIIADIDEKGIAATADEITSLGREVLAVKTDVSRKDEIEALVRKSLEKFGHVDILINNAGVGMTAEIRDMDIQDWEWIMGINLWGAIYTLHYLLPHMTGRGSGHIINVASAVGLVSFVPIQAAYTITKFALVGLSDVLRTELHRFGIGVTAVCPGSVKTNLFQTSKYKGFKKEVLMTVPDFMFASPEKVARKIVRAVKRDQAVVIITALAKLIYLIKRISPALSRQVSSMNMKQFLKHKIEIPESKS